jgi:argininosuccinate lyase
MYRDSLLGTLDHTILNYTSSMAEDALIAEEVIQTLMAHVHGLREQSLIPEEKGTLLLKELNALLDDPSPLFSLECEDIHEALETYLKAQLGSDEGYMAMGKSRNDHIAAALRLKTMKLLHHQILELLTLREILCGEIKKSLYIIMPAFTHLQPAQPSTFAHYLSYIEEMLSLYTDNLFFSLEMVDNSPLGTGAVGGTRIPIDRKALSRTVFHGMVQNSIAATSTRDFLTLACSVDTNLSVFLSRIAEDIILFTTPQFQYVSIDPHHLSTSSMMPQKKNVVTMEVARAWGAESIGHLTALLTICKGLPTGYNLDLQEANKHGICILKKTLDTLRVFSLLFKNITVCKKNLLRDSVLFPILATDITEEISLQTGEPYRTVFEKVANIIKQSSSTEDFYHKIKTRYNISLEIEKGLEKPVIGSPNPEFVIAYLDSACEKLTKDKERIEYCRR